MRLDSWRSSLALLVVGLFLAGSLQAGDKPGPGSPMAELAVGTDVVLTEPGTMLRDGERQFSSRGERIFRVERLEGGFADIATEDQTVRGWVEVDRILPLGKAIGFFNGKIAKDPKDAQAYQARGQIWIEKEEWDRALADLDSALRLAPSDPKTHHLLGLILVQQKQFNEAITSFSQAIKLDPGMASLRDRGLAWDAKRFFDKAFADLTEAIRLDPGNVALVLSRGKVCSRRGRHIQAMADFDWFIRMRPNDPAGYAARGEELMENLESEAAIADFTRAIEVDPNVRFGLAASSQDLEAPGDFARTIDDYAEATRRAPDDPEAYRALAWILATCLHPEFRDGPRAVRAGTTACELTHWNNIDCLTALAAACAEAGDFPSAAKWQARVIKLLPKGDYPGALRSTSGHVPGQETLSRLARVP